MHYISYNIGSTMILHVYTWIVEHQDVNENVSHVNHLNIKSPLLSVEGYHHVTQCFIHVSRCIFS